MTKIERIGWAVVLFLFLIASGCGLITAKAADSGALPGAQQPATKVAAAAADEAVWAWLHQLLFGGTVAAAAGVGVAAGNSRGRKKAQEEHELAAHAATVGAARVVSAAKSAPASPAAG